MGALALACLIVTGLAGTVAAVDWYDGERQHAPRGTGAVVAGHISMAVAALVLLAAFLLANSSAVGWITVVALVATAGFGITAFRRSASGRLAAGTQDGRVAPAVLVVHGAAAGLTVLLALLAAAR